jgi:hypothetical protein
VTALILIAVGLLVSLGLSRQERENLVAGKMRAGTMVTDLVVASLSAPLVFEDQTSIEEATGYRESNATSSNQSDGRASTRRGVGSSLARC